MKKIKKIGYSLNEIGIVQSEISYQNHRGDVNPYIEICKREVLPIFVAPMASVTDENNYQTWIDNKLTPVIPRSVMQRLNIDERLKLAYNTFVSFSLQETIQLYEDGKFKGGYVNKPLYICVDIAHGTLESLYDICKKIKEEYGDKVIIMTGNIANAKAYKKYCECGIDYVRVCIGSGSRCTTACATGIFTPMATLLDDIAMEKSNLIAYNKLAAQRNTPTIKLTKIVADGGISWYSDIQKCLVLGADAVMIGRLFAECEEACGEYHWAFSEYDANTNNWLTTEERDRWVDNFDEDRRLYYKSMSSFPHNENPYYLKPYRLYSGMSHRSSQKITGGDGNKVSEGICKHVEIKYPINHFLTNVVAYLRSCMTYINASCIEDMQKAEVVIINDAGDAIRK